MCTCIVYNMTDPVNIGEFRQRATELLRAVTDEGITVTIARRGRPVAQLRPLPSEDSNLVGSVTIADGVDLTEPVVDAAEWAAG